MNRCTYTHSRPFFFLTLVNEILDTYEGGGRIVLFSSLQAVRI